jgi:heme-degrading monooxygenase HmoA
VNLIPAEDHQGLFAVNVFTVRPENQQALVDAIRSAGDPGEIPGLLSIHLLRSLDGRQVINHMHWASKEAFEEAVAHHPAIEATRAVVEGLIENARPNLYEVVSLT